ncbi:sensor histidine kinase [Microbacterium sp. ASV81]|uniref:Histidine kinase n=1 Tax=Microbacterium capsulatum TaxID=3041921 RepID=A0ABU0XJD3_9MICO|nr:histidine kinase [Microbacterium sp. ASV81]MDQ4215228.1 histidine kinase [Microbacterium sp. ASV81]
MTRVRPETGIAAPAAVPVPRASGFMEPPAGAPAGGWGRFRAGFLAPGSRFWYPGAVISLLFEFGFVVIPLLVQAPTAAAWAWSGAVLVFGLMFIASVPVAIWIRSGWEWLPPTVLLVASVPFIVSLGSGMTGLWVYVAVAAAVCLGGTTASMLAIVALAILAFVVNAVLMAGEPAAASAGVGAWAIPLIIVSVGTLMASFARNLRTMQQLRRAQTALAEVAVEEERNRVARDMHDILGHSLSAIALKAELAATLSERDPRAAAREIREVQDLARATLGDMRAVVSGHRQVRIASELASLRTLLSAAGIAAHLPTTTDDVPERNRELFGWTLREAGTNVIRHSRATECWVALTPGRIVIEDDGSGPQPGGETGTGLRGLAERAADAGGALRIARSAHGGFLLEVSA